MDKSLYGDLKLGVLGGGQLGRMLIQAGMNFNVSFYVLDGDSEAPCSRLAEKFTVGPLMDFDSVYNFGKTVDMLTIEIEHVNTDAMEKLESEGVPVYPSSKVLKLIQDKGLQKQFMADNGLPTAKFRLLESGEQAVDLLHAGEVNLPFVLKLRKGGYDGRGVLIVRKEEDLAQAFKEPCVLEDFVGDSMEIAVMVARSTTGEVKTYPSTEMVFHPVANLLEFQTAPARIAPEIEKKAEEIAIKASEGLGVVGLLAVEMFVTKTGEVLINEMAPRPHNSGHHTIEGNQTSQFEQHLRAIFGLPLGSTATLSPAVLVNILGEMGFSGNAKYEGMDKVLAIPGVHVHLYGKKITKPFRKMGHAIVLNNDLDKAMQSAKMVEDTLKVIA
ncbi:MAG: 5-(carboxyamino)imidazole ribonucleotide synthase [Candidatus Gracilibacteria bacterium]